MNDDQLLRYSRHILLDPIGIDGQQAILDATVLVLGAGGLGSPAALYLAASGIGRLLLADGDNVDLSNLQRQIIHSEARIGQPKSLSGQLALAAINPQCQVEALTSRLDGELLEATVARADVVVDCCDNFATRHAVNRACQKHRKPLVSGAAIRFDGQLSVFDPRQPQSPCYHCLFPEDAQDSEERCAVMGVFAPLTGIVGTLQAAEALKLLAGAGDTLCGRLLMIDALSANWRSVRIRRDPACPVCAGRD